MSVGPGNGAGTPCPGTGGGSEILEFWKSGILRGSNAMKHVRFPGFQFFGVSPPKPWTDPPCSVVRARVSVGGRVGTASGARKPLLRHGGYPTRHGPRLPLAPLLGCPAPPPARPGKCDGISPLDFLFIVLSVDVRD
jgi:hypothetical protein